MRKPLVLTVLAVVLAGQLAFAGGAGGVPVNPDIQYNFTDCAAGGSGSQSIPEGEYLLAITDADIFLCYAGTCAAGGVRYPVGLVMRLTVPRGGRTMSCRSAGSVGDVNITGVL